MNFENIECEWPMFYTYLILDGLFTGAADKVVTCTRTSWLFLVHTPRVLLSISSHACKKPQTPFDDKFKHESCIIFVSCVFNIIMTDALCRHRLQVENYADLLDEIMLKRDDGIRIMPELYVVPKDKVLCSVQLW